MKILATFPIYTHPDIASNALSRVINEADVFVAINNPDIKHIAEMVPHVVNEENNFCNGAWNQGMKRFLDGDYDWLVMSSQDVLLREGWSKLIPARGKEVYVPSYASSLDHLSTHDAREKELRGGIAGACTFLPRAAVELIYPIPQSIKLWFGDEWMYGRLWKNGWRVMQAPIAAYHYGSLSITTSQEAYAQIEADKLAWEKVRRKI